VRSDDLASTFTFQLGEAAASSDLRFHQGLVLSWNANTGHNVVRVAGTDIPDVPVLTSAGLVVLAPGDPVMVLKYKSAYFVVGRITTPNSGLVQPQWPIVLYPLFLPVGAAGTSIGYSSVNAGVLASWEGRARISHPKIEVDGVWGVASGTGTVTYILRVDNIEVGRWTLNTGMGLQVGHGSTLAGLTTGGFDVSRFLGQDWVGIKVEIISNTVTGQTAFQVLGVFFRQT
jgi:hypothetical protein